VALYGDSGEGFEEDSARYATGFGVAIDDPDVFVLAHVVQSDWTLGEMLEAEDWSGDCWFIWLAAGTLSAIIRALAPRRVTKWVAFERRTHPCLAETRRFLPHGKPSKPEHRSIKASAEVSEAAADHEQQDGLCDGEAAQGP
jgi:hypothetical protein